MNKTFILLFFFVTIFVSVCVSECILFFEKTKGTKMNGMVLFVSFFLVENASKLQFNLGSHGFRLCAQITFEFQLRCQFFLFLCAKCDIIILLFVWLISLCLTNLFELVHNVFPTLPFPVQDIVHTFHLFVCMYVCEKQCVF